MLVKALNSLFGRALQAWSLLISALQYCLSPYGLRGTGDRRLRARGGYGDAGAQARERRICVLVLYSRTLTMSRRCWIDFWRHLGFDIVVVNNLAIDAGSDREWLATHCWHVFERVNMGQDIGAYRDVVLWLNKNGHLESCAVLALTNDSLQFIPGANAKQLAGRVTAFLDSSAQEALFSHQSYQHCRHYQSFFQILKPSVFLSRPFLSFWQSFQPLNNRLHCVIKGELELSRRVYNSLRNVSILYTPDALCRSLRLSLEQENPVLADRLLTAMPSIYRTQILGINNPALATLLDASRGGRALSASEVYCLADLIENNNPSHVAAFLYPLYLFCPFVKKDLCFAGSFPLAQAINLYQEALEQSLGPDKDPELYDGLLQEYATMLREKNIPLAYRTDRVAAMRKGLKVGFFYAPTTII